MYEKELQGLGKISQAVGNRADITQGGGGNTSAKLNDELMAVKASGFALKQVTDKEGYVVVNYKNIKKYYDEVDLSSGVDYEKDSVEFAKRNVVRMEGLKDLRPSVEAGFHSVLKKYVIHTHSVYANIICCATNGKDLLNNIYSNKDYGFIWIPYINPGFSLTLKIKEQIEKYVKNKNQFPKVVFMENHGLIVTADDCEECIELNEKVNEAIKEYFNIKEAYPDIKLTKIDENVYKSSTTYLTEFFKGNNMDKDYFDKVVLYPDQLVYLSGNVSINGPENKLNIDTQTGEVVYRTNYQEALAMEETLVALLYVINGIKEKGLSLKTMTAQEIDFIANWESEKYRKKVIKN